MKDFLKRALFANPALKAVALVLAITLYLLVNQDKPRTMGAEVKVVYTQPSNRVLVSDPIDSVRIEFKGRWTRVRSFDESSLEPIHIDLTRLVDGEFLIRRDMVKLPPGLELIRIEPSTIRLAFETTATKVVPVFAKIQGSPARGFKVQRSTMRPSHVTVRGPKTAVDQLAGVDTEPISVEGRSTDFVAKAPVAFNDHDKFAVVDAPEEFEVEVAIVEESATRRVDELTIEIRFPNSVPGNAITRARVTPTWVAVVLRGGRNAVDLVDDKALAAYIETHSEDASGRARRAPILLDGVPAGVAVELLPRDVALSFR